MESPDLLASMKEIAVAAELALAAATSSDQVREIEISFIGKRGSLADISAELRNLDSDSKRTVGEALNAVRSEISRNAESVRTTLREKERLLRLDSERRDLSEFLVDRFDRLGSIHLISRTRAELEDVFVGMGFSVEDGPEVETEWNNFEALNIPRHHPARASQDSFFLRFGEQDSVVLRTHTSPTQIRVMQAQKPPIYAVMPGRVYRRDTADSRHTPAFHQIEGLVVDKGIGFGDLAGTIETFTRAYFGPEINSRLRPAFFPFTEPSAEFEITCTICGGTGCRTCSGTGWIELGGCGMVHPNVFKAVGIDPEEWTGFAFGFGIDRCAQMRHSVSDARIYLDNDIRFLSQF